jgi:hypothetical protein
VTSPITARHFAALAVVQHERPRCSVEELADALGEPDLVEVEAACRDLAAARL